jgi:hypothetical protein
VASEEVEQLAVHGVCFLRRVLNRVRGAMAQVIFKQPARHFAQSLMHGRNLYENVCAITIFFNHSLKSSDLAFDAAKAVKIGGFDLWIDPDSMFTGSAARMPGFV